MSISPEILKKVKLLLNLTQSPNQNEADNARVMAEKLIAKHGITEQDLASLDPKEYYGENEKLFVSIGICHWKQTLAVAVSRYFECQIVQEEIVPVDGEHEYRHFVYGENDQVKNVQFAFHAFVNKVEELVVQRCIGRGNIYIESYCEGVVESIKTNIDMFGIEVPEIRKPLKKEETKVSVTATTTIIKSGENKEEPTDKRVDITKGSFIRDIMAYFKGVSDGKDLSLQDILELESQNEDTKILQ